MKRLAFSLVGLFLYAFVFGQMDEPKYGNVTKEELSSTSCPIDSMADAYYLFEYGSNDITRSSYDVTIIFRKHIRIKILKNSAFDYGKIKLYARKASDIHFAGCTYNLENGEIVASHFDNNTSFKDKISKHRYSVSYALPNIKEGSVIEFEYTIETSGINEWFFQHDIPVLYSQYTLTLPSELSFTKTINGTVPIREDVHLKNGSREFMYFGQKVKAFRDEPYMLSRDNYISYIDFDFSFFKKTWMTIVWDILSWDEFGQFIKKNEDTHSLVTMLTSGVPDTLSKAKAIYYYIRNHFTWDEDDGFYASKTLPSVLKDKNGNSADLNLLLVACLKNAGMHSDGVVLSTHDNGILKLDQPRMDALNYVLASVVVGGKRYLLDVTDKYAPFGMIPVKCINEFGVLANLKDLKSIVLSSDYKYLHSSVLYISNCSSDSLNGKLVEVYKGYAGNQETNFLKSCTNKDQYIRKVQESLPGLEINNFELDIKDSVENSVILHMNVPLGSYIEKNGDMILINPLFFMQTTVNIFPSQDRTFPVVFPITMNDTYILNFDIPEGYTVESYPKSISISFAEYYINYRYVTSLKDNKLQIFKKLEMSKGTINPNDYKGLKAVFDNIITKEAEMIVLKKA